MNKTELNTVPTSADCDLENLHTWSTPRAPSSLNSCSYAVFPVWWKALSRGSCHCSMLLLLWCTQV